MQHNFICPQREVSNIGDVTKWLNSDAHLKYMQFLRRLNDAVKSVSTPSNIVASNCVEKLLKMLDKFENWIGEHPPEDMGAQRFGNKAYRKWYEQLSKEAEAELLNLLPYEMDSAKVELLPYLMDSFGNSTRIDYGSGHEASFAILLFCLYEMDILAPSDDRAVVLRVFHRYLKLVRKLQCVYRMEPAGSRGVHAIDDFQFLPFLFGSSQLIGNKYRLIPDFYLRSEMVAQYQDDNLFFEAIQYINETKTGPFYEHSNQLYNISAVPSWEKINQGMFKMYEGEVLKKFPVVQHFLFGSLFQIKPSEEVKIADGCVQQGKGRLPSGLDKLAQGRHPCSLGKIPE